MTNEAAERLRRWSLWYGGGYWEVDLDEALAIERRAGADEERERIRAALEGIAAGLPGEDIRGVYAILAETCPETSSAGGTFRQTAAKSGSSS